MGYSPWGLKELDTTEGQTRFSKIRDYLNQQVVVTYTKFQIEATLMLFSTWFWISQ